jgi:hypothetical protein
MHGATVADRGVEPRLAGALAVGGAALMLVGAGIWASTGTDLDDALVTGEVAAYLVAAADHRAALVANLSIWIVGVLGLGAAGTAMAAVGNGPALPRDLARFVYWVATSVAIIAFVAWMAIIVQLAPTVSVTAVSIAEVVGWFAYRADAVATALIVGVGPALLAWAGRRVWVPGWLFGWGMAAAVTGALTFVPYFVPAAPFGLTFVIVPVGIGWTLAAGVVLLRHGKRVPT